jgi:hypothetical protein
MNPSSARTEAAPVIEALVASDAITLWLPSVCSVTVKV